jgi:hypothetical protein
MLNNKLKILSFLGLYITPIKGMEKRPNSSNKKENKIYRPMSSIKKKQSNYNNNSIIKDYIPEISIKAPSFKKTKKENPKIETKTEINKSKIKTKIEIKKPRIETSIKIESSLNQTKCIKNINDTQNFQEFKSILESKMDILNVDKKFLLKNNFNLNHLYFIISYIDNIYENIHYIVDYSHEKAKNCLKQDSIFNTKLDFDKQILETLKIIFNNDEHIKNINILKDITYNTSNFYNLYSNSLNLLNLIFNRGKNYKDYELNYINKILKDKNEEFNTTNRINYFEYKNKSINEIPKDILETHKKNYNDLIYNLNIIINKN